MNKEIKDFCINYKKKLKNDKEIEDRKGDETSIFQDYTERIRFSLNMYKWSPGVMIMGQYNGTNLITLDSEDLEYFYKKYSKKLREEMQSNVEALKDEYKDLL